MQKFDQYINMPRRRRRRWPVLSKMTARKLTKRPTTPEIVRKLVESREHLEFESISPTSELSDAFEEFHKESFLNRPKNGKKSISKHEGDILAMSKFTDDFKNTMQHVKDELQIGENMFNEDLDTIKQVIAKPRERKELPTEMKEVIEKILSDPEIVTPSESITPAKPIELAYDYMSGVWNMLEDHCKDTDFKMSQMDFNAYNKDPPYWLIKPDVSQQVIDESKLKCQKWLKAQQK